MDLTIQIKPSKNASIPEIVSTLEANGIKVLNTVGSFDTAMVKVTPQNAGVLTFLSQAGMGYVKLDEHQKQQLAALQPADQDYQK